MRVGISAYLLHEGADYRAAGVSTYTRELVRQLPVSRPDNEYIVFHGPDAPPLALVRGVKAPLPTYRPPVRIVWEQAALPLLARSQRLDVLHGTVNVLPVFTGIPSVVTVHDLAFLRHPERFQRAKAAYLRNAVARSVRRATRVIAVSEHTRSDLIDLLDVDPERIRVVSSGVDPSFRPLPDAETLDHRERHDHGRPSILHVGTLEPRKNIDVLIRAFARLRSAGYPHLLNLVGARGWMYEGILRLVDELHLRDDVRLVDYVHPTQLPLWYNAADLFAYPSAYEGFGLPLLEAMACGTPAITTTSSSLRELAGDACLTVPPGSEESLYLAMAGVLNDADLRRRLRTSGIQRAAGFTWEACAVMTADVYAEALEARL